MVEFLTQDGAKEKLTSPPTKQSAAAGTITMAIMPNNTIIIDVFMLAVLITISSTLPLQLSFCNDRFDF